MSKTLVEYTGLLTRELARRWRCSVVKICTLIERGELPGAFDTAVHGGAGKKPRWLIPMATIEAFERRRAVVPPPPAPRRRKKANDDVPQYV
jgi:hypothetical protein